MFNDEGDWSDEEEAQTLSQSVFTKGQKKNTNSDVKQSKTVGKKSLLRTLQTLGSVPDWKNDDRQQDSDSEAEVASAPSKKKKKRSKKKRHAKTSDEHQENGDASQPLEEKPVVKKPAVKKSKKDEDEVKTTPAMETKGKGKMKSVKALNAKEPENGERLSRKQWKNKMKNKRKCTNKFRTNNPEVDANKPDSVDAISGPSKPEIDAPKEEVREPCTVNNNDNNRQQKKMKEIKSNPQKRKKPADATDAAHVPKIQSQTEEKKKPLEDENENTESPKPTQVQTDKQNVPAKRLKPELTKEQTLKREKLRKMLQGKEPEHKPDLKEEQEQKEEPAVPEATEVKLDRSASLRSRMEQRLDAARFRYINEVLYSTTSGEARRMFSQDPDAFWIYHRGYTSQVQRWPSNPVDAIITYIQQRSSSLVVADFGCGDCKIARSVKNKVHSFDLAATCELVTVCDMANVPLGDDSVDIAVFCLSLMGTNLAEFLSEANRVLKMRGILKVAEVASRFDNVRSFMSALAKLGFKLLSKDTENTHFYSFEFEKTEDVSGKVKKVGLQLKPCVYKKR